MLVSLIPLTEERYEDNGVPKVNQTNYLMLISLSAVALMSFVVLLSYQNNVVGKDLWKRGLQWKISLMVVGGAATILVLTYLCTYIIPIILELDLFWFYELVFVFYLGLFAVGIPVPFMTYIYSYIKKEVNALEGKSDTTFINTDIKTLKSKN